MTHGYAQSMKWLQGWVPALARKYPAVRYDIRGCGQFNPLPPKGSEWSAARLAKDALNLIDHLGISRVHWVGYQSGGIWGMFFASSYPDRVASLTVCNTPSAAMLMRTRDSGQIASGVIESIGFKQWVIESNDTRPSLRLASREEAEWHREEHAKTATEAAVDLRLLVHTTLPRRSVCECFQPVSVPNSLNPKSLK